MKHGRNEDKATGPIFPRLHVDDAYKGGPLAPPRNKMALYEQLSIPSQKSDCGVGPHRPTRSTGISVPSAFLMQGSGHERNAFSSFYVPPQMLAYSAETVHSSKDVAMVEPEILMPFCANSAPKSCSDALISSTRPPNSHSKPLEQNNASDTKPGKCEHNHCEEKPNETSATKGSPRKRFTKPSYFPKPSPDQDQTSTLNAFQNFHNGNAKSGQGSCGNKPLGVPRYLSDDILGKSGALRTRNELCPRTSLGNNCYSPDIADKGSQQIDENASGPFEVRDAEISHEVSEALTVDSIPGVDICPDDVIGVIGFKKFWKARRAIVNQQRVFSIQVFELHRLIKVQKLIAASPHLLLEGNTYLNRSPAELFVNDFPPEHTIKSHVQTINDKGDILQKSNQKTRCPRDNMVGALPLPSCDDEFSKELPAQVSGNESYSENPLPVPMTPENKASPWCFHESQNQWLVPVMSPSEGLVYKPYTGPCPPAPGFVAPIYGSCIPFPLPPIGGDFMTTVYGVSASHQQQNMGILSGAPAISPNYFPSPYSLPVDPIFSSSAVEQASSLAGLWPHGHAEQHSRSSCNMSNPKSGAFSDCRRKFQASKDSELQGSTASSPGEKVQEGRDVMPLFPMAPASEGSTRPSLSCGKDNQNRVIKVVPHNARSAIESAARIFRSIQEERQRYEL